MLSYTGSGLAGIGSSQVNDQVKDKKRYLFDRNREKEQERVELWIRKSS
ncbi:MAG: hypothetical protein IJ468_12320 [Lachnospiraceae bacterium]|nr:hypothetical protein [Lachnospiraceae bacterium]